MELSSCPQCSAKRNIPLSFSFFLTNRFHLALSCGHCGARYVPTMLQRIVQLVLVLVLGTMLGLLYVPALKLASTLSRIGLFGLQPFRLFALLLLFGLAHWLPLRVSAVEAAGRQRGVPPRTICLLFYHFFCEPHSGDPAGRLPVRPGSPARIFPLIAAPTPAKHCSPLY